MSSHCANCFLSHVINQTWSLMLKQWWAMWIIEWSWRWFYRMYLIIIYLMNVQMVKSPPAMQETWVRSLGGKVPWRRAWQPTPVFLPGESPWTEKPGRLQSMGSQRFRHNWVTKNSTNKKLWKIKEDVKKIIKCERYINFLTITQYSTNMFALCFFQKTC